VVLVVQAAPWRFVDYELQLTSEPVLQFPVEGKDEKAIQSFWGAPRDGGRRKHEGNDIFAPKGTPLLALTDGKITRVNNGGLGGKTVWLYDAERGLRYYYAHLDEQLVTKGQRVRRGDVVGTVGNTGNARTWYLRQRSDRPLPFLTGRGRPPPRSFVPNHCTCGPAKCATLRQPLPAPEPCPRRPRDPATRQRRSSHHPQRHGAILPTMPARSIHN